MCKLIIVTLTLLLLCGFAGAQNTFCAANQPCVYSGNNTFSGSNAHSGTETFTGLTVAALAPRYLYANQSTYWRWQLARASASQIYTAGGGAATAPVHVTNIGDSISGFGWLANIHAMAEYMPLNALGYGNFYSIHAGSYGSAVTYSQSAGCVDSRNDNTSAQNFGPGGSRIDCSGTWTISYAPVAQYRFDTFYIVYEQTGAGGSFSYTVDGGAPVTVNTAGTELLGITTVTIAGASQATTHTIALANVSGSVRLYGMGTSQRAQPGFILDFVQSGGSQLAQWVSFPAFTQQLLAYLNPGLLYVRLGANDGGTGVIPAATFGTNLSSWLTAIAVPSTTATVVLSNTPRGTTVASPQTLNCTDDAATGALYEGYRTQMFNLSASLGFSIYDERRYWPGATATYTTFATGCAAGMNTDNIHPSNTGSTYEAYGLAAAIFQGFETPSRELSQVRNQPFLMTPAATINAAQSNSNGTITDSGTGFKAVSNNAWDFFNASARFFRFGTNESGSINAITAYPTASQTTTFSAYRQGSIAARAYSFIVNSDASTSIDTNNGDLVFSVGGVEHGRMLLNSGNTLHGMKADNYSIGTGVSWTAGAGAPVAGNCTTAKGGSLYSRTDGTTTTTLYVCDGSTGVWTAK